MRMAFVVTIAALGLSACSQTTYVAMNEQQSDRAQETATEETLGSRQVHYEVGSGLYRNPPNCVIVMAMSSDKVRSEEARVIESAVARHLGLRVDRVIDPAARDAQISRLHVDLNNADDRLHYSQSLRCPHFLDVQPWGGDSIYALFWNQERLGLHLALEAEDGEVLWQAKHLASRGDGAIPINPISAVTGLFLANQMKADQDVRLSLADDAVRRMIETLPDFRYKAFQSSDQYHATNHPSAPPALGIDEPASSHRPTPDWMRRWTRGAEPGMMEGADSMMNDQAMMTGPGAMQ